MFRTCCFKERQDIDRLLPSCMELARQNNCNTAFQYMDLPILWFDYFKSENHESYEQKRGRHYIGGRSRLTQLYLVTVTFKNELVGALPLVTLETRVPGDPRTWRILTLPGDPVLVPYCDFLVKRDRASDIIPRIIEEVCNLEQHHDWVLLRDIPEDSENSKLIEQACLSQGTHRSALFARTGQQGGFHPWNFDQIRTIANSILAKYRSDETTLRNRRSLEIFVENTKKDDMFYAGSKRSAEKVIRSFTAVNRDVQSISKSLEALDELLSPAPTPYPYIELPDSPEAYLSKLSSVGRRSYRRYRRKLIEADGAFEVINSNDIKTRDIQECLDLHQLRWGLQSAFLSSLSRIFLEALFCTHAERGRLTLLFASVSGKRIASIACVRCGDRMEAIINGRNLHYADLRAGAMLTMEAISHAIGCSARYFDLGPIDFDYKKSLANKQRYVRNFIISKRFFPVSFFRRFFLGYESLCE